MSHLTTYELVTVLVAAGVYAVIWRGIIWVALGRINDAQDSQANAQPLEGVESGVCAEDAEG